MIPTDKLNKRSAPQNAYASPTVYPHYVMEGTQACPNPWDIEIARLRASNQELVRALEKIIDVSAYVPVLRIAREALAKAKS